MSLFNSGFTVILANLIASLGSGWILATGLELSLFHDKAWGDSILAFLIGGCLSLVIASRNRKRGRKTQVKVFSFLTFVSLVPLYPAFNTVLSLHPAILLMLLSIFFCLSLLARTERIAIATKTSALIFPVELAYALGSMISLFASSAISVKTSTLIVSFGGAMCILAFLLDVFSPTSDAKTESITAPTSVGNLKISSVALDLSALTLATQVVSQLISRRLKSPAPLGAFDAGTTLAPILCTFLGASLIRATRGEALKLKNGFQVDWGSMNRWVMGLMFFSCLGLVAGIESSPIFWIVLPSVFVASCLYEAQCLVRLEAVGQTAEGRQAIPVVFSIMAVTATVTYSLFLVCNIGSFGIMLLVLGLYLLENVRRYFPRAEQIA